MSYSPKQKQREVANEIDMLNPDHPHLRPRRLSRQCPPINLGHLAHHRGLASMLRGMKVVAASVARDLREVHLRRKGELREGGVLPEVHHLLDEMSAVTEDCEVQLVAVVHNITEPMSLCDRAAIEGMCRLPDSAA